MMVKAQEARVYKIESSGAERDAMGRMTQRTVMVRCPFCQAAIKAYLWSLSGNGKRCTCGVVFLSGGKAFRKTGAPDVRAEPTSRYKRGREEWEAHAPAGWRFGDAHSLILYGCGVEIVREIQANAFTLRRCEDDCECRDED